MLKTRVADYVKRVATRLGTHVTVRVLRGPNAGLRWTAYPVSGYWRSAAAESDTTSAVAAWVHPGSICFDLGAHYGFYTCMMALKAGKRGHVYAFEPEPFSFGRLQRHIVLNRLGGQCTAFNLGASDADGEQRMFAGGKVGATTTHFRYSDEPEFGDTDAIRVKIARLDSLIADGSIKLPHFIKVDVEGHAVAVLDGARDLIAKSRPVVLLSTHGPHESKGIYDFFRARSYKAKWSLSGRDWFPEQARADEGVLMMP